MNRQFYNDNDNIIGPLSKVNTLIYDVNNPNADAFAKDNNIDVGNVYRILGIYNKNNLETINSEILSKWLNITPRSCNRIIAQLLDQNLIEEVEIDQVKSKGRPPKYYRFIQDKMDNIFFKNYHN